ncbi:MAG: hypothetical protein ACE5D0_02025 [Fidelibacterota bacterium]
MRLSLFIQAGSLLAKITSITLQESWTKPGSAFCCQKFLTHPGGLPGRISRNSISIDWKKHFYSPPMGEDALAQILAHLKKRPDLVVIQWIIYFGKWMESD